MRWVTRKPPAMLMVAIRTATAASSAMTPRGEITYNTAPMTIIPLMALVTLISGVCSEGVTFQITM